LQEQLRFRLNQSSTDLNVNLMTEKNSVAYGISEKFLFSKSYLKLEHNIFDLDYSAPIINFSTDGMSRQINQSTIETQFPFLINNSSIFLKLFSKKYLDQNEDVLFNGRFFKNFTTSYFLYEYQKKVNSDESQTQGFEYGQLSGSYKFQLNGTSTTNNKIFSLLIEKQMTPQLLLGSTLGLNSTSDLNYLMAQVSYDFNRLSTLLSYRQNQENEWIAKIGLFSSTFFSVDEQKIKFDSKSRNMAGQVMLQFYIDKNNNRQFDPEDQPLKNVKIRNLNTNQVYSSNSQGAIYIQKVDAYRAQNYKILIESVSNIYLFPENESIDFILTSAESRKMDMAFVGYSEVQGEIISKKMKNKLNVEIVNTKTQEKLISEVEPGHHFNFKKLSAGSYTVSISAIDLRNNNVRAYPKNYQITLPVDGKYLGHIDFLIKTRTRQKK
jgi:hypothetical protein